MRPLPDVAIVGAPKSGTSSLFRYLASHPGIVPSSEKEPQYFATDLPGIRKVATDASYRRLFGPGRGLTLEASVWYLFSDAAVPNLLEANPACRLIACIRSPARVAASLHGQYIRTLQEDVDDFEVAWQLQSARAEGERLPRYVPAPELLQYASAAALGDQVERLLSRVRRDQVHFVRFEELVARPEQVYREVLSFLSLPDDGRTDFPRVNESRMWRSTRLVQLARNPPRPLGRGIDVVKSQLNRVGIRPLSLLRPVLTAPAPRPGLSSAFTDELDELFAQQVRKLEALLGWDLSDWRPPAPDPVP